MAADFDSSTCVPLGSLDPELNEQWVVRALPADADQLSMRDQRVLLFYVLYAADSFDYQISTASLIDNISKGFCLNIDPQSAVYAAAEAIIETRHELDGMIRPLLANWRFERLGVCTRIILRLALWELNHTSVSPTIIINEAVELAKLFAEKDAYKFINGILDEAVRRMIA